MALAAERTSFHRSLRIQLRVLGALFMREVITRYGRANLGVGWLFFEPILFTLAVTALWAGFRMGRVSAVPIVASCATFSASKPIPCSSRVAIRCGAYWAR